MAKHFSEHLVQRDDGLHSYGRLNEYYRYSFPNNTPEQIWQKFICKNDQIFMVLSGHNFDWASDTAETLRVDLNQAGHPVYQFCIDYQYRNSLHSEPRPNGGGDGWMRLVEFDIDRGLIQQITYSPALRQYETDHNSSYAIPVDFQARFIPASETGRPPARRRVGFKPGRLTKKMSNASQHAAHSTSRGTRRTSAGKNNPTLEETSNEP
jgi:hypothetical protein